MKLDIAKLRELAEKATPGPWQTRFIFRVFAAVRTRAHQFGLLMQGSKESDWKDAEFIAASRTAIPELLRRLDVATEALEMIAGDGVERSSEDARAALKEIQG